MIQLIIESKEEKVLSFLQTESEALVVFQMFILWLSYPQPSAPKQLILVYDANDWKRMLQAEEATESDSLNFDAYVAISDMIWANWSFLRAELKCSILISTSRSRLRTW